MRDKQVFDEHMLSNGIKVFEYKEDTPFTRIVVQIPVGTVHNTELILPGTFHFLEHMITLRSLRHPVYNQFCHLVGLKGGTFEATTKSFWTTYALDIPSKHLKEVLPGFFSQLFEPVFQEEDIALQRGIISNERKGRERWYPGSSEEEHYLRTQWQSDYAFSLCQMMGNDAGVACITPDYLYQVHQNYHNSGIQVIIGGSGDVSSLLCVLSEMKVEKRTLPTSFRVIHWINQEYHEKSFRDQSRFSLQYGGILSPRPEEVFNFVLSFILRYFTNTVHGPLYEWLREEKGWVYDIGCSVSTFRDQSFDWTLKFPLNNLEQVYVVRNELQGRINKALANSDTVSQEVDRAGDTIEAYGYQTLEQIMNSAESDLERYGFIRSESHIRSNLELCRNTQFLQKVWTEAFAPEKIGCFCALPLKT